MIFIENLTNDKIRNIVSDTYFLNPIDRMTIDLLTHYAYTLHENVKDLTDDEINKAKDFAENYLRKTNNWKFYEYNFDLFTNRQRFNAINNIDYDEIEIEIYKIIKEMNELVEQYDWDYRIYYSFNYENKLLLSMVNKKEYHNEINLIYDIKTKKFSGCDIEKTNDMEKLGMITYDSYADYELNDIKI